MMRKTIYGYSRLAKARPRTVRLLVMPSPSCYGAAMSWAARRWASPDIPCMLCKEEGSVASSIVHTVASTSFLHTLATTHASRRQAALFACS